MATKGSGLKSTSINGVKMYMVSSQQRNPAPWDYQQKIELVQDVTFPTAMSRIKATPDGEFLIASGIYPPQIKVYELREFALKFERHFDSEIIDFQILDDDYSKLAFLCADRSVCLHAKYGKHYT
uniref:Nucleolar protein 10-like N-terminal domain-containing protein n=1 Tax=Populus trichocarpa TaxID=3694 RepID=B9H8U1_POPTR